VHGQQLSCIQLINRHSDIFIENLFPSDLVFSGLCDIDHICFPLSYSQVMSTDLFYSIPLFNIYWFFLYWFKKLLLPFNYLHRLKKSSTGRISFADENDLLWRYFIGQDLSLLLLVTTLYASIPLAEPYVLKAGLLIAASRQPHRMNEAQSITYLHAIEETVTVTNSSSNFST